MSWFAIFPLQSGTESFFYSLFNCSSIVLLVNSVAGKVSHFGC